MTKLLPHPDIDHPPRFVHQALVDRICRSLEFAKVPFHPLAGRIIGDRQYFFDGGAMVFPWADPDMHRLVECVRGASEPQEILPFLEALKNLSPDPVVVEMGAGWGLYSIVAGRRLPTARLILVEANPRILEVTRRNIQINSLSGRATILHAAAGAQTGGWVKLRENGYGSYIHRDGQYDVSTLSVDGLMERMNLGRIDMLHLDVQGAEVDVLHGARAALHGRAIRYVLVGTHSHRLHERCRDDLAKADYQELLSVDLDQSVSGDGILVFQRKGESE